MAHRNGYIQLTERIDDEMRTAAWSREKEQPDPETLEGAVYFWPETPRTLYQKLAAAVIKVRRKECECNGKRKNPHCHQTRERANKVLSTIDIPRRHRISLTHSLSQLAHMRFPSDRSSE